MGFFNTVFDVEAYRFDKEQARIRKKGGPRREEELRAKEITLSDIQVYEFILRPLYIVKDFQ